MNRYLSEHDLAPATWLRPAVHRGFRRQEYVRMGAMTTSPPPPPSPGPPAPGPWVERWLSQPRHAVYLTASKGDPQLALASIRGSVVDRSAGRTQKCLLDKENRECRGPDLPKSKRH
jgi:hypothetical protein